MREKTIIYTVEFTDIVKEPELELEFAPDNYHNRTDELALEMQKEPPYTLSEQAQNTKNRLEEKIAEILAVDKATITKLQVFEMAQ